MSRKSKNESKKIAAAGLFIVFAATAGLAAKTLHRKYKKYKAMQRELENGGTEKTLKASAEVNCNCCNDECDSDYCAGCDCCDFED